MQTLRWTGMTACAILAVASLVLGIVYLTEGSVRGTASGMGWAVVFGVSTVLLWRRVGWRCAGAVFGLLLLGFVVVWMTLVELHAHGYF